MRDKKVSVCGDPRDVATELTKRYWNRRKTKSSKETSNMLKHLGNNLEKPLSPTDPNAVQSRGGPTKKRVRVQKQWQTEPDHRRRCSDRALLVKAVCMGSRTDWKHDVDSRKVLQAASDAGSQQEACIKTNILTNILRWFCGIRKDILEQPGILSSMECSLSWVERSTKSLRIWIMCGIWWVVQMLWNMIIKTVKGQSNRL